MNTKASFDLLLNGTALPIKYLDLKGTTNTKYNELKWKFEADEPVLKIALEASLNGKDFNTIMSQNIIAGVNNKEGNYKDFELAENKFYRIKTTTQSGEISYSNVIALKRNIENNILVSPNPFKEQIQIDINNNEGTEITYQICDITGKQVIKNRIIIDKNATLKIDNLETLTSGIYFLSIWKDNTQKTFKIIKQ